MQHWPNNIVGQTGRAICTATFAISGGITGKRYCAAQPRILFGRGQSMTSSQVRLYCLKHQWKILANLLAYLASFGLRRCTTGTFLGEARIRSGSSE